MNAEAEPRVFTTTRWSLVLAGANSEGDEQKAAEALAELCRTYWRPIFSYVCRRGYSSEDAQDLTQDFFLMILETHWLRQADKGRGRFRSLLLKSLQNFLHNVADRKQTLKRGGSVQFVSWDAWMAEAPSQFRSRITRSTRSLPSGFSIFAGPRQSWTRRSGVCEKSVKAKGVCGFLRDCAIISRPNTPTSHIPISVSTLGIAETVVKKQLHNLRQRYRWLLREEVAHTVENPADVDDEIRHLCAALAAAA